LHGIRVAALEIGGLITYLALFFQALEEKNVSAPLKAFE
jgi:hypothetical protein